MEIQERLKAAEPGEDFLAEQAGVAFIDDILIRRKRPVVYFLSETMMYSIFVNVANQMFPVFICEYRSSLNIF